MNPRIMTNILLVTSLAWCSSAAAEVWNVTVGDNFFSPNDLTIQVGDTVRWTANGNMSHDVTADDGSFASATSPNLTYERTFNTAEEILYYCSVHSTPGRDINVFMNGRINVVGENQAININAGMSDSWYNPATLGQGFFIIVWEDLNQIFLSWFTFDTIRPQVGVAAELGDPGHRWLTAQGAYSGDTATLDIFETSGGVFDAADPAAETDPIPIGSMLITWSDCSTAELLYDIPDQNLSGALPLQRIVPDNVPLCEAGQQQAE